MKACSPYACGGTACVTNCAGDDAKCAPGYYCSTSGLSAGMCLQWKATGASCSADDQCATQTCCAPTCVDETLDVYNCGGCGVVCPAVASKTMTCSVTGCSGWAPWPMPSPVAASLPTPASFDTTSQSGVVIDKVTGLWWQQPIDVNNNQAKSCAAGCDQADAVTYCANLTLAGHTDWRLPTRIELVSIFDWTVAANSINATAFPGSPADFFWTAMPKMPAGGDMGWVVDFSGSATQTASTNLLHRVRCVR